MNIKEEYINKTKEYLGNLRKKIDKKEILKDKKEILKEEIRTLKDELKILKSRQKINDGISFENELGIKSNVGAKGIDDLIVTLDTQICCLEAQIENIYGQIKKIEIDTEKIDREIKMYDLYIKGLKGTEKEIIKIRYLAKKGNSSFRDISKKIRYSKSHVVRIHDNAIKELTYYIFGEMATYA